ncbi:hypothetical protein B0H14DRAFT_2745705 [Mycena olivaceomarginata]|nr:hypothetical protein B0H14DRAFT_2745705 [Mycena olivaceomarginata]
MDGIISTQVASLTPTGIHLEDGLLLPAACIFLNGTHLRVFEAVLPRPDGTPLPSVRAYLVGLGIQVEVMSTVCFCPMFPSQHLLNVKPARRRGAALAPETPA